jgi:predicted MFS family arabinose efflux permease
MTTAEADQAHHDPRDPRLGRTVSALGVAQIISWGSLFYAIAVLGSAMRRDLGISDVVLFGSFTMGLFLSGVASPLVGREIDSRGGRRVLAAGSLLGAVAMIALAAAQGPVTMLAGWLLAGVAMSACLYDPAFATLHQVSGTSYRRAVTALTLFGGFASTVFWPLSQYLLDEIGWRQTFVVYAGLHLFVCLPLHLLLVPRTHAARPIVETAHAQPAVREGDGAVFAWLATALALAAFMGTAMAAHVIDLLTATGLSARDAVLVGSLIGPMQVAGRVMEFAFGRHLRALAVGTLAFALMAASLAVFTQVHGLWIVALAFAMIYGWSNGVMTIVRGTVPAELFGPRGYGTLLGRLARPQFILKSSAPLALTLLYTIDPAKTLTPYALLLVAVAALLAYRMALVAADKRKAQN